MDPIIIEGPGVLYKGPIRRQAGYISGFKDDTRVWVGEHVTLFVVAIYILSSVRQGALALF